MLKEDHLSIFTTDICIKPENKQTAGVTSIQDNTHLVKLSNLLMVLETVSQF